MAKIPNHFSLIKEHPETYEIHDKRDGHKFHIAKSGLDLDMHGELSKVQRFEDGGEVKNSSSQPKEEEFDPNTLSVPPDPNMSIGGALGKGLRIGIGGAVDEATPAFQWAGDLVKSGIHNVKDFVTGISSDPNAPISSSAPSMPVPAMSPMDQEGRGPAGGFPDPSNVALGPPSDQVAGDPIARIVQDQADRSSAASAGEIRTLQAGVAAEAKAAKLTAEAFAAIPAPEFTPEQRLANFHTSNLDLEIAIKEGKIDPDRLMNSKGTGEKIGAALGLIFGGIGSGMTGGPNLAYQSIQSAIDRDIAAQKDDQSKNMNLWKMNREATQDSIKADLDTQNMYLIAAKTKAAGYAAEAQGPIAAARVAPTIAALKQAINMNTFKRAALDSTEKGPGKTSKMNPALMLNMIPDKGMQEAVGKEISYAEKIHKLQQGFEESARHIESLALNGLFSPHDVESAMQTFTGQAAAIAEHRFNLQESLMQGRALLTQIGDMGQTPEFKARRRQQFFSALVSDVLFKSNTGMSLQSFESTTNKMPSRAEEKRDAELAWANQNANNPNTQTQVNFIKSKHGVH